MTHIIASIALAGALYFSVSVVGSLVHGIVHGLRVDVTWHNLIACAFWGMLYYCTHKP